MNATIIGILIISGVGALAFSAYMLQIVEKNRQQRKLLILDLTAKANIANRLLHDIPTAYQPEDIRQFLISYCLTQYQSILEISPRQPEIVAEVTQLNSLQAAPYKHKLDQEKPVFVDVVTAKRAAVAIKDLVNFLVSLYKQGVLEKDNAQKLVNKSKMLYLLMQVEVDIIAAEHMAKQGSPKGALTRCISCRDKMLPFAKKQQLPQRRQYIEKLIQQLRSQISATQQRVAALTEKQPDEALAKQWQDFEANQQEDVWQKKQDYEV